MENHSNLRTAIFAGGCFWCTEAVFLALQGVQSVQSGYIGGHTTSPTYKDICKGDTGHAEAISIVFDSEVISYTTLVELFFATHNPTTLNRQGNDIGTQYRSEIFYLNDEQRTIAAQYVLSLTNERVFEDPIVTQISAASTFYPAEDYHVNYYNRNKEQSYCDFVITPKIAKFRKVYSNLIKKE